MTPTTDPDLIAQIVRLYRAGQTMAQIADALGIATTTVHSRLIDAGEPRRPRHGSTITPSDRREWADLHAHGYGSSWIADRYGRSPQVILNAIRAIHQ